MKSYIHTALALTTLAVASPFTTTSLQGAEDAAVYTDLIVPIMTSKCVGCHGEEKQKGKLRVDTYEFLKKGGGEGAGIVPGKLDESLVVARIALPLDDDDHMPPSDKDQLTEAETKILRFWVEKGASPDAKLSTLGLPKELEAAVAEVRAAAKKNAAPVLTEEQKKAAEAKTKLAQATMDKINATGASLMPIAQDTPQLRFSALNVKDSFGDAQLAELLPVADQIAWLDLANSKVTDAGLATVAKMTNLARLHLELTGVTDAGLEHLKGLGNLEYLNLYNTPVSDAGLEKLTGLKKLTKIFLWQSKVTPAGADKLVKAVPALNVNLGWQHEAAKNPVVAVAAPTPAPAVPAPAPAPAAPKPAPAPVPTPAPAPVSPVKAALAPVQQGLAAAKAAADKAVAEGKSASDAAAKASAAAAAVAKAKADVEAAAPKLAAAQKLKADREKITKAIIDALELAKSLKNPLEANLSAQLTESNKLVADAVKAEADTAAAAKAAADAVPKLEAAALEAKKAADAAAANLTSYEAVAAAVNQAIQVAQTKAG